jgi:flagellar assembly protein FliH
MWVEMVRLIPGLALRPEVRADTGLQNYELVLESNLGVVDLGVRAQLEEIERGFFDLLEVRREPKGCAARPVGAGKQV